MVWRRQRRQRRPRTTCRGGGRRRRLPRTQLAAHHAQLVQIIFQRPERWGRGEETDHRSFFFFLFLPLLVPAYSFSIFLSMFFPILMATSIATRETSRTRNGTELSHSFRSSADGSKSGRATRGFCLIDVLRFHIAFRTRYKLPYWSRCWLTLNRSRERCNSLCRTLRRIPRRRPWAGSHSLGC